MTARRVNVSEAEPRALGAAGPGAQGVPRSPAACGMQAPGRQRQEGCAAEPSPGNTYSAVTDLVNTRSHLL